jgi:hypothetical protein
MTLTAGAARASLRPKVGAALVGYFNRVGGAAGEHDPLMARALVLANAMTSIAICAVDVCVISAQTTAAIRLAVQRRCPHLGHVLVLATHTHSAPALHVPHDWHEDPVARIAGTIAAADAVRAPARLGAGSGLLLGCSINRRYLDRPVDPCVGVVRIDSADGRPVAILGNFACHNVVLGPDNLLTSADWTGAACAALEARLGGMALMSLGGAGDVNPITAAVAKRLARGDHTLAIGAISAVYGPRDTTTPRTWNIEDRTGGTFAEAAALGAAVADAVALVWQSIATQDDPVLAYQSLVVDAGTPQSGQFLPPEYGALLPEIADGRVPLPVSLLRLGDALWVSHPVETFSEDAVHLRRMLQQRGFRCPVLVTYANGWYGYLPPAHAFPEGGYEVGWAQTFALRQDGQALLTEAVLAAAEGWRSA